jgi:ribosome-associated protein
VDDQLAAAHGVPSGPDDAGHPAQPLGGSDDAPGGHVAPADPRQARRPGLPSRRAVADEGADERPVVLPGSVDEVALALAHRIVELAADKKASDIVLLDVRAQTAVADYFVICSGASDRQLAAISDGIVEGTKAGGTPPLSREGDAGSHWLLLDYGSVIVHVMSRPERDYYQLEKLWADAALLVHLL